MTSSVASAHLPLPALIAGAPSAQANHQASPARRSASPLEDATSANGLPSEGAVANTATAASLSVSAPACFPAQGSAEWLYQRCGKLTASRMGDVMARTKTGYGAARANYLAQLVAERLSGLPSSSYESPSMAWGKEYEDEARRAYMFRTDRLVAPAGFVDHPEITMSGASPDGYVGEDGLIEIKAPNTTTHLEIVLAGTVPDKYLPQIFWQLACTGRQWCDFVSYDPRLPEHLRFIALRIARDEERIRSLEEEARTFLAEVEQRVQAITARVIRPPHHA